MIKINVCTQMRNNEVWSNHYLGYTKRFFDQLNNQVCIQNEPWVISEVWVAHNDSSDNTLEVLKQEKNKQKYPVYIVEYDGNVGPIRSTGESSRIQDLSNVADSVLVRGREDCDFVLFVESDLYIFDRTLIANLLHTFSCVEKLGAVAPLVFAEKRREIFYDYFVFRNVNGVKWQNNPPWYAEFNSDKELLEMGSIGSCVLMKANIIRDNDLSFNGGAFIEMCRQIRENGYKVYVNKNLHIYHPFAKIVNQRAIG